MGGGENIFQIPSLDVGEFLAEKVGIFNQDGIIIRIFCVKNLV